jgi:hypothetical protein
MGFCLGAVRVAARTSLRSAALRGAAMGCAVPPRRVAPAAPCAPACAAVRPPPPRAPGAACTAAALVDGGEEDDGS